MFTLTTMASSRRQDLDGNAELVGLDCFITIVPDAWQSNRNAAGHSAACNPIVTDYSNNSIDHQNYDYE